MSRINWNRLSKNIPTKIKIAPKREYEILHIKDFHGVEQYGETRFDTNQIILKTGLSPKLMTETYWHEILHAISEAYNIGLTEEQVLNLEAAYTTIRRVILKLEGLNE